MLDIAIVATCGEAVEIGSVGHVGRIPEVVIAGDILTMEYTHTPLVVDVKGVDGITEAIDEIQDDKSVVDTVAIGSYHIGELEEVVDDKDVVGSGVGAIDGVA